MCRQSERSLKFADQQTGALLVNSACLQQVVLSPVKSTDELQNEMGVDFSLRLTRNNCCNPQAVWNAYVGSMRQAGFTADIPMYVASGLLTYGANDGALPCAPS